MGNTNISNQVSGNYLKSLKGNNGMFDMSNPNIYKQKGGEYDPYMDIDSTAQKRRTKKERKRASDKGTAERERSS